MFTWKSELRFKLLFCSMTFIMGCSSSRASHIKVPRTYDDVRSPEEKDGDNNGRGVPDGQEKYTDVRERTITHQETVRKYRQCQVTQSTYISESTTSLEQSLT
ncbi:uncharacterized protein LOC123553730 [Mercenaria mercenaria]|uniref:uncharacterized protein LOC123553730 n=1 Tax=Mercenaria mercenaria TaxID=6596 RepID=UPI001E1D4633|nr:uncharacterized protein LOC123553730 [Mercenaria mercenaria]